MKDENNFSKAGDVVSKVIDKIVPPESAEYGRLNRAWSDIVGNELAFHVIPKDIVRNILILDTDHPGWIQRIRMRESYILGEIRRRYPQLDIKRLKIRIENIENDRSKDRPELIESHSPKKIERREITGKNPDDKEFFALLEKMRQRGKS